MWIQSTKNERELSTMALKDHKFKANITTNSNKIVSDVFFSFCIPRRYTSLIEIMTVYNFTLGKSTVTKQVYR